MHPSNLKIADYTYHLPDEKVAQYPLEERHLSKLLVYKHGQIKEDVYLNIANYLPAQSLLVFNNTRVIQARLFFKNATGAKIEIFCLEPAGEREMATAMAKTGSCRWYCMVGRASKWKEKILVYKHSDFELTAELVERTTDAFIVEFKWQPQHLTFAEILDKTGMMPIPPYLNRGTEEVDLTRYQTVYAKHEGSVAAPTAGLHFSAQIFDALRQQQITTTEVTLHVGAGTFKPVKAALIGGHEMHAELLDVPVEVIEQLAANLQGNIIAVGTTALRTIETLFWMGVKAQANTSATLEQLEIKQWDPYDITVPIPDAYTALTALIQWMKQNGQQRLITKTSILIAPPYKLKVARALVTNFHQPNSTLLLLVAAVVGNNWHTIYNYALNNNFRFLSYGDGSLLFAE